MVNLYDSPGRRYQVRLHLNLFNRVHTGILGKMVAVNHDPVDPQLKQAIKSALHALGAPDDLLFWGALYGFDTSTGRWRDHNFLDWLAHPTMVPDSWEATGRRIRREHLEALHRPAHISGTQLARIQGSEGYYPNWYRDPVGVPTCGYGHTGEIEPGAGVSVPLSPVEAVKLLRYDLRPYEAAGLRLAPRVSLTQPRFDVTVDFAYNAGIGALASSTFLRQWIKGNIKAAADALLLWNKGMVNGRLVELPGLTVRCEQRRTIFLRG
jgi:lysozyme